MRASIEPVSAEVDPERNHLEIIRFPSDEARRRAYGALIASGKKLSFSTFEINVWNLRTEAVRVLLAAKVPFDWLTRNVK